MRWSLWCARTEMDEDIAEKAKADRALRVIYLVMVVFTVLPFALFFLLKR
jgi:hypothetical protein